MRLLGTILLVTALGGCSVGSARLTTTSVPPDFTLEVRDATGEGALFIVEPDRWFRAATGAIPDGYFYPPATRLLTPEQMESLWRAVEASGVLDAKPGIEDVETAGSPVRVYVQVNHQRTVAAPDLTTDAGAAMLLEELRELAWIRP